MRRGRLVNSGNYTDGAPGSPGVTGAPVAPTGVPRSSRYPCEVFSGRSVVGQVSRIRGESTASDDYKDRSNDDDDDNNNNDDAADDDNDSDGSLESVDLTSHDVDDDEDLCKGSSETVRATEESSDLVSQRQKSERIPVSEVVTKSRNSSFNESEGESVACDVIAVNDALSMDRTAQQSSVSLDNKVFNPLSGVTEVGSNILPGSPANKGSVFVESSVRRQIYQHRDSENENESNGNRRTSVFDDLLFDIYDRWHAGWRDSFDSDTFTDMTESDAVLGRSETEGDKRHLNLSVLKTKGVCELEQMISDIIHRISQMSSHLVRQLKCRERRMASLREKCDIVTAILHASSLKRRIDSKIRFSIEPFPGDDAFGQWKDAMRAIARLPSGIPPEFRKNVWLALADNYLSGLCIDWEKTKRLAFNEKSNPDDNKLGLQIVKDLHRTGCSGFNGQDNEEDRAVLKRVLLAYARWNKLVGYCQGFNILAALILDVVDRKEDHALKVMIYLIDRVLPESYFANNLRALSVDMAVFRDLLRTHLLQLSRHLDHLQNAARDQTTGASYEPPLTNVFTMQWFLTLFATCLPKAIALRVWDSVLLEGSEILLRASIAIWGTLESRILSIPSADEFYSSMGILSQEMLDGRIVCADRLMKDIYSMAPFPFPQLSELREKYTYNITPFTASLNAGRHQPPATDQSSAGVIFVDDEDLDEDELIENINCFAGLFLTPHMSPSINQSNDTESSSDVSKASPGAYAVTPVDIAISLPAYSDRITLDINMLHKQYARLKQRQKQAHIILAAANARQKHSQSARTGGHDARVVPTIAASADSPTAVNHLFVSRQMMNTRSKNGCSSPGGSTTCDDYRGRSSILIPQQAAKLIRSRRLMDGSSSLKLSHNHGGKGSVESLSSDIRNRSDSIASVNESESGFGRCDSISSASLQYDESSSSVSTEEMSKNPSKKSSLGTSDACDCITCELPNNTVFESPSELEEALDVRLNDEADDGADSPTRACKFSKEVQNSLTVNMSKSKKIVGNSPPQSRKTDHRFADSNPEPLRKPSFGRTSLSNVVAEDHKCLGNTASNNSSGAAVKSTENSTSETAVKVFNPFPKQYMHPRKTLNNVRLGLYSEIGAGAVDGAQTKRSAEQVQRTAYLQRQYMMHLTKQSKVNKS